MAQTWPTLLDPVTPQVLVRAITRAETGRSLDTSGAIGRGLLRPFRRDSKQDFVNGEGVLLIAASIGQILGTICGSEISSGELPWRTEFGSLLHLLRLRNNSPALIEEARAYVAMALSRWEPRARITGVRVLQQINTNRLVIKIAWRPQSRGTDRVVVPGLETEIALG